MNILIVGNGFVGYNLALGLQESEYNLVVVDKEKCENQSLKVNQKDIKKDYSDIFKTHNPHIVFYLIREKEKKNYTADYIADFIKFMNYCVEYKVKKVVILSSYELTHENCSTCNGTHKYKLQTFKPEHINQFAIELYLHYFREKHGIDFVSLRTSHIYGRKEYEHWSDNLIHNLLTEKETKINTHNLSYTNLIYIGDVVSALIYSIRDDVNGIYNIINNDIQYRQIVDLIKKQKPINVNFNNNSTVIPPKKFVLLNTLDKWKPIVGLEIGITVVKNNL
jgi:nucleoside-diphosphate-sugar epimerase